MQKKMFEFKTKTIVATGLGAALFTLLFMYVKVPTGIPETDIQTAYGIGAFFGALFGPIGIGLVYPKLKVEEGIFGVKDVVRFNIYQIISNIIAWVIVAPVLDIVVYAEPVELVFKQGWVAAISNAVSAGVIGTVLLFGYSKTRAKKGSLTKEG